MSQGDHGFRTLLKKSSDKEQLMPSYSDILTPFSGIVLRCIEIYREYCARGQSWQSERFTQSR